MARRYFTLGEVDRLVPRLERIFVQVMQLRAAMRTEEMKLERAGVRLSPETLQPEPTREQAREQGREPVRESITVRQARLTFKAYYEVLGERLAEVERLGGEVKDLDMGLVDFLARRGAQDILLCWKLGERNVGYWHPVDAGFRGRRPIDDEVPREPQGLD
jgi:hypothetical protein